MIHPIHELIQLANKIGASNLDAAVAECYRPDIATPAKAIRLMAGLRYFRKCLGRASADPPARYWLSARSRIHRPQSSKPLGWQ